MNKKLLKSLLATVAVISAPVLCYGQTSWNTTTGAWNVGGNWTSGVPSGGAGETVTIATDGAVVNLTTVSASRSLTVSGNGTATPILNITNTLNNNFSIFSVGSIATGSNYSGTVNHTAGAVTIGGGSGTRRLNIAASATGTNSGNSGTYNFGGAVGTSLLVQSEVRIANRAGETGLLSLSDIGSFTASSDLDLNLSGGGNATLAVSGGGLSISANRLQLSVANSNVGMASLNATFTSTGFSTINVTNGVVFDNTLSLTNNTAFNLTLNGFTGIVGQKITVINAGAAFTGFGAFANVADGSTITSGGYQFLADYDNTLHDFTLEVTVIPEPSALALMVASLCVLVILRRRRMA